MLQSKYKYSVFILLAIVSVGFLTCKKEKSIQSSPEIISLVFNRGAVSTTIKEKREVVVEIPDYVDRKKLVGVFQLTKDAKAYINGVLQKSSETENDFTVPVKYTIVSSSGERTEWSVRFQSNNFRIGLGNVVEAENRLPIDHTDYYYVSQDLKGTFITSNGGAACLAMALRWASPENAGITALDISKYAIGTTQVCSYLTTKQIPWKLLSISTDANYSEITECIDKGYLVIMCVDFARIPYSGVYFEHVNRFWTLEEMGFGYYIGHYFVIKGYKKVDGKLYYETYDPFSHNERYPDNGEPKGYNRYYNAEYVRNAAFGVAGWEFALVVGPKRKLIPPLKNELDYKQQEFVMDPDNKLYKFGF